MSLVEVNQANISLVVLALMGKLLGTRGVEQNMNIHVRCCLVYKCVYKNVHTNKSILKLGQ